jgi:hypothetical protein
MGRSQPVSYITTGERTMKIVNTLAELTTPGRVSNSRQVAEGLVETMTAELETSNALSLEFHPQDLGLTEIKWSIANACKQIFEKQANPDIQFHIVSGGQKMTNYTRRVVTALKLDNTVLIAQARAAEATQKKTN